MDKIISKPATKEFTEGHERIFGKKRTPMSTEYYPPRDMSVCTECTCGEQSELPLDVYNENHDPI